MPVFEYTALNTSGKTVSGIVDAESALSARQKLRSTRIFPTSLKEVEDAGSQKSAKPSHRPQLFSRVRPVEVMVMTRQLAILINAGFPLVTAMDTMIPQTKSAAFKKVLARIKDALVEGNSFAGALSLYPSVFSPLYINMVRAGESSGTLEIILTRLAEINEKQMALTSRLRGALAYPILMTFVGAAVLFILMTFIVPNITSIFEDMNQVLPAPTRLLIALSELLQRYWWVFALILIAGFAGLRTFKKTDRGLRLWDKVKLYTPGIGSLVRKMAVARFSRTLGSLLANGVSMMPALEIVRSVTGNVLLSDAVERATNEVEKGQGLAPALDAQEIFPYLSVQMIQVGEQSGELESMLDRIADVYEGEVESTVMRLTSLLEPVMILIMAVIVGFIVISICLPIFEMNQLVQ
ncbi:MAG: type II secretion system F family protein [Desulfobacterales bacterium]|nr:type II secretion system F family protein [Desulfobacterales bacterium]